MKMKSKVVLVGLFLVAAVLLVPSETKALELSSTLVIEGPSGEILNRPVPVADSCDVVDTAGGIHTLTGYVAACALQAALDAGYIADFEMISYSFGLWLDSINSITTTPNFSQGWAVWKNGVPANVGVQGLVLSGGDTVSLTYGPWPSALLENQSAGGPIVTDVLLKKFDVERAVSFLTANQQKDGSFGSFLFSDWVAVAFGAYEGKSSSVFYGKEALKEWLLLNPIPLGNPLTDYERRAMALMSLGIDPYKGTSTNYIEIIMQGFDGQQFGSPDLVNDDIFAALVLRKAGYEGNVTPLLETLPFILSWQREDGSFGNGDLTAAAIQAISLFSAGEQRDAALVRAQEYVASQQGSDGGFGNVYSTSWALQAIDTNTKTAEHYLSIRQALDGGLLKDDSAGNRIWATAYAVPAALQKSWGDILNDFEKPAVPLARVAPADQELTQKEIDALGASLDAVAERISQIAVLAENTKKLESIEQQLSHIAAEIEALRPQAAVVYSVYVAQLEQPTQQVAQFNVLDEGIVAAAQDSVSQEEKGDEQFTAEAAGTARNFFASSNGQAALVLLVGIVLFLALGGWRIVLSLGARKRTAV
tara:strand:+ start:2469 stop:4241 length:1773 start_codon:yes stop_codon:yes gene_type:complete